MRRTINVAHGTFSRLKTTFQSAISNYSVYRCKQTLKYINLKTRSIETQNLISGANRDHINQIINQIISILFTANKKCLMLNS